MTGELPRRTGRRVTVRRVVLVVPALVSVGVLGLAGLSTYADPGRRWVALATAGEPDALPAWWATVLYVLVALACWSRAWAEALRRRANGRVRATTAAAAWLVLGALLSVLSADHVLGVHRLLAGDPRLTALPGPVAAHPVQVALLALGLPVVAVLLALVGRRQRVLLVAAGCLYVVSGVVIDQRLVQPSWNHVRLETLELSFEWAGALVLMAAAASRVRMPGGRGGPRRPEGAPPDRTAPAAASEGAATRSRGSAGSPAG